MAMLALSSMTNNMKDDRMGSHPIGIDEFLDFSDENLFDSIDFDDIFMGMDGGDVLPDLEMDTEMFVEFSSSRGEESEVNTPLFEKTEESSREEGKLDSSSCKQGEEIVSKREESVSATCLPKEGEKTRKSSTKNAHGKRKVKVDWTPELHRKFVKAVEQLGIDKAVPSRILELMGIACLTRHNIASHLQKYRSHQKHSLAREVEAADWNQRRQMYTGRGGSKNVRAWVAPAHAMGFPPMAQPLPMQHFRPLHVWGHPFVDQSLMHVQPKHLVPPTFQSPPPTLWIPMPPHLPPTRPPQDHSFWHRHQQKSKESIDAAISDVLSKPWSPLPLGLKPPSIDGVLEELQCQGVADIPHSCA